MTSTGIIAQSIASLDPNQFHWNGGNSITMSTVKPNHNVTFHDENRKEVGVLDFNGPQLEFKGNASVSAQVFIRFVAQNFSQRLSEERDRLIKDIEALGFATDEQRETAKIIIHYLQSVRPN